MTKIRNSLLLTLLIVGCLYSTSNAQVLGIDFGSEYWKVSLISPGKSFVILENMTTQRKTDNAVNNNNIY